MKNKVYIISSKSKIIQQTENKILCIFSSYRDAENYLKIVHKDDRVDTQILEKFVSFKDID